MRRNGKYNARKTLCVYGHTHASRKEAQCCNDLHLAERAGEITHLVVEPQFYFAIDGRQLKHENGRRVGYKPDFAYREKDGRQVVIDAKGVHVRDWPLRKAIFKALYPHISLLEV